MLLAIDIGNTNIVFGMNINDEWANHWRIQTDPLKTADEYDVIFRTLLATEKTCRAEISGIIVSSVVPSLVHPFREMLPALFESARIHFITPNLYKQLPLKIPNPYEIGTDLVANSMAAFKKYGNNTMVIDFGTALTFTTIGSNADILGVAIAPGLNTAVNALAGKTAQLPQIHIAPPPSVIGKNTVHAIQSGIIFGYTGLVESMIERTEAEINKSLTVVATGGLSSVIAPLTKRVEYVEPMLTLDGLVYINSFL
ncbi:MAG TPA: type III pantothenate kinase [Draconibacterium sp.]|nr:type III pantothenate kinase [Draconibacterium sp.]